MKTEKLKIYFAAAISLDRKWLPVYQKMVGAIKELGHEVLSEQVVDPELVPGEGITAQDLFNQEIEKVEKADVMVADVTAPSWGTAFLMEHALEINTPVLAMYHEEAELPLPLMIAGHPELYVEHYDETNLKTVLRKNLEHFALMKAKKGKLIVIDGGDGAGKATQTRMLLEYLAQHNQEANYIAFPRYKTSFHGHHVGRFLTGEFGGNTEVSPYLSSLAFALDRLTARDEIVEWLEAGHYVVADRYISASLAHQGSKLEGKKREEFLNWLYDMEYKEHKLPKEDIVLFLYVPVDVAQRLLAKTQAKGQAKGKDIAEVDLEHQRKSIELYATLAKKYKHWVMVECVDQEGNLMTKEAIHQKILDILKDRQIVV